MLREIAELALELGGTVLLVAGVGDRIGIPEQLAADARLSGPLVDWPELGRLMLVDEHAARLAAGHQALAQAVHDAVRKDTPPTFSSWLV